MRRLMLLRHAKTENDAPSGQDQDRRLDDRGRLDAAAIGGWIGRHPPLPDAVLVSTAVRAEFMSTYDETQAIGRRYRRQDEIGTPLCVTVDFVSLEDGQVTIRERDSMAQVRVPIADLVPALRDKLRA